MRLVGSSLLILCLMACFWTGCVEKEDKDVAEVPSFEKLSVEITHPQIGEILSGEKMVEFDCEVSEGDGPYSYSWTSNIDGHIASTKSFTKRPSELSKGSHTIIVKVSDSSGMDGQGSIFISVL